MQLQATGEPLDVLRDQLRTVRGVAVEDQNHRALATAHKMLEQFNKPRGVEPLGVDLVPESAAGGTGGKTTKMDTRRKSTPTETGAKVPLPPPEPLAADISSFWSGSSLPEDLFGEVRVPSVPAALLKRLGSFPFWRGEERFLQAIEPIYTQASPRGLEIYLTWR